MYIYTYTSHEKNRKLDHYDSWSLKSWKSLFQLAIDGPSKGWIVEASGMAGGFLEFGVPQNHCSVNTTVVKKLAWFGGTPFGQETHPETCISLEYHFYGRPRALSKNAMFQHRMSKKSAASWAFMPWPVPDTFYPQKKHALEFITTEPKRVASKLYNDGQIL